eukprot:TRINITY_DN6076_c0_g1_i2.p1 TRINITY_DN6076_c0_g1~~TRINITY_DN6076_c0_g1_i2.p1  ORF type:complete len:158 (+),score=7.86 TRINITY_DN6076_c0_g1_i2:141-614(+)
MEPTDTNPDSFPRNGSNPRASSMPFHKNITAPCPFEQKIVILDRVTHLGLVLDWRSGEEQALSSFDFGEGKTSRAPRIFEVVCLIGHNNLEISSKYSVRFVEQVVVRCHDDVCAAAGRTFDLASRTMRWPLLHNSSIRCGTTSLGKITSCWRHSTNP